jgi:hypothetical protein
MTQDNQRILELCRKVSMEKDGGKMTELVRQLNQELDKVSDKKESQPEKERRAVRRA